MKAFAVVFCTEIALDAQKMLKEEEEKKKREEKEKEAAKKKQLLDDIKEALKVVRTSSACVSCCGRAVGTIQCLEN